MKRLLKMKSMLNNILLFAFFICNYVHAENTDIENYNPVKPSVVYQKLSEEYNISFEKGIYEEAYVIASHLTMISPNSTDANFRLILAARELNIDVSSDLEDVHMTNSNYIEGRFKALSYAVFHSPNNRTLVKTEQEKKKQKEKIIMYFNIHKHDLDGIFD